MADYDLPDGVFSLDGYEFGRPGDDVVVLKSGLDTGGAGWRVQDADAPSRDGRFFGRDYMSPPTWVFTVLVKGTALEGFAQAWRGDTVRSTPAAVLPLAYRLDGETRVVYGRPRGFAPATPAVYRGDLVTGTCEFALADPIHYSGVEHTLTLSLVTSASPGDGLVLPAVLPWLFDHAGTERRGVVDVGTSIPVPFRVWIRGPLAGAASNFSVWAPTWRLDIDTTLTAGGNITVDTAAGTVIRNSVSTPGILRPTSTLTALMQPGPQEVVFTADDPSVSVSADIIWRDGYTAHKRGTPWL